MDYIVGIDPGLNGAIAFISNNDYHVFDIPIISIKDKKRTKRKHNVPEMVRILKQYPIRSVYLEKVHAMPKQGVTSMFSMGHGLGLWEGIITTLQHSLTYVTPQEWKKKILNGMPKGKGSSMVKATQLYPKIELLTKRGRELDGRADALLIAHYGLIESG